MLKVANYVFLLTILTLSWTFPTPPVAASRIAQRVIQRMQMAVPSIGRLHVGNARLLSQTSSPMNPQLSRTILTGLMQKQQETNNANLLASNADGIPKVDTGVTGAFDKEMLRGAFQKSQIETPIKNDNDQIDKRNLQYEKKPEVTRYGYQSHRVSGLNGKLDMDKIMQTFKDHGSKSKSETDQITKTDTTQNEKLKSFDQHKKIPKSAKTQREKSGSERLFNIVRNPTLEPKMTVEPNNSLASMKLNANALIDQPRVKSERNIGTNSKGNILDVQNDAIVRNPTPITSSPVDLVSSKGPSSDSSSPNRMSGSMNSPNQFNDAKVEKAFEVIGMKKAFKMDAIKKQFRRAILMQHPDKSGNTAKAQDIISAYQNIIDYISRKDAPTANSATTGISHQNAKNIQDHQNPGRPNVEGNMLTYEHVDNPSPTLKPSGNTVNVRPGVEPARIADKNSKGNILEVNNDAIVRNPAPLTSSP
ncbi:hypothetical protein ROZALSC1DRAFT_24044, partial [Rozella allomycis CSF55]